MVFVGDSGLVPDGQPCDWRSDGSAAANCHITVEERARLKAAIRSENGDAIYGLGDLVSPHAPGCTVAEGNAMQALSNTIGSVYDDVGAPTWLVLGNHDVGHLRTRPRRVRCLLDFARQVNGINLPAAQYTVDHGLATVVVANTNDRDQGRWPAAAVRAAEARGDWVILAAHHELRTAFEKVRDGPWEPPPSGQWLVAEQLHPHLYANGHAHALQFGAFDARTADGGPPFDGPSQPVLMLTSGAASKLRANPTCGGPTPTTPADQAACALDHPRGMPTFAMATFGFAVVDITPDRMTVRVLNLAGDELTRWTRSRSDIGPLPPQTPTPPPAALTPPEDSGPIEPPTEEAP